MSGVDAVFVMPSDPRTDTRCFLVILAANKKIKMTTKEKKVLLLTPLLKTRLGVIFTYMVISESV